MLPISCERLSRLSTTRAVPLNAVAICARASDASSMAARPTRVCSALARATRWVSRMLSAMFSEVALNSSTAPAMLVISPDCCSMPSLAPPESPASSCARWLTSPEAPRIRDTMPDSASPMRLKLSASWPISSRLCTSRRTLRSPAPNACACCTTAASGLSLCRSSQMVAATARIIASRLPMASRAPMLQVTSCISAAGMLASTVQGPPSKRVATL